MRAHKKSSSPRFFFTEFSIFLEDFPGLIEQSSPRFWNGFDFTFLRDFQGQNSASVSALRVFFLALGFFIFVYFFEEVGNKKKTKRRAPEKGNRRSGRLFFFNFCFLGKKMWGNKFTEPKSRKKKESSIMFKEIP